MKNVSNKKVSILTVTLECKDGKAPENEYRDEILKKVLQKFGKEDIILFSRGFYEVPVLDSTKEATIVNKVGKLLTDTKSDAIVCLGINANDNGNGQSEQIVTAITKSGIVAKGRKFYPTKDEKNNVQTAKFFDVKESGYERFFECKGKKFYLAVGYDVFGIRHCKIVNPGVNAVLNSVYRITPKGKGSGFSYYIRYGFGGASLHWNCPVFGAAVFFERKVPETWQSGFQCNNRIQNLQSITYADNTLQPNKPDSDISTEYERAFCCLYTI
jgi:hypothetical protein